MFTADKECRNTNLRVAYVVFMTCNVGFRLIGRASPSERIPPECKALQ